ncbi:MAG: hypothetical protein MK510_03885 [SAR324 cluster bacterium]|nr:hypothetical protein [SAR324 cluster bacterium]
MIRYASLLHDFGRIGVKERVPEIEHAHHEKLNCSGYPQHLTEDEIPKESKIMTISDTYAPLTVWDRSYKNLRLPNGL